MKSETSIKEIFLDVFSVARPLAVASALAVSVLICAPAVADNRVKFHGSVVNATCNLRQITPSEHIDRAKYLELKPGVMFQVEAGHNACTEKLAPFVAHYRALPAASTALDPRSGAAGIITLTYQ